MTTNPLTDLLCQTCGVKKNRSEFPRRPTGRHHKCKLCTNKVTKAYQRKMRERVIDHYGRFCRCCGETTFEFLAVHHVSGGGNAHRRAVGVASGSGFIMWLLKHNYPGGFQVLCHNCNMAEWVYGVCPHKTVN